MGYPVGKAPFLGFGVSFGDKLQHFKMYRVHTFRKRVQFAEQVWTHFYFFFQKKVWKVSFFASHAVKGFIFLYFMRRKTVSVQLKPLNGITLGQRKTDFNTRLIIIRKWATVYKRYESVIWELSIWINLIPLTQVWPTFFTIGPLFRSA